MDAEVADSCVAHPLIGDPAADALVEEFAPLGQREASRLIHAQVRRLLRNSDQWDTESWGLPLSAAHLGLSITAFSARMLRHLKSLGVIYNDGERRSFVDVWRCAGHLMGIPEAILYQREEDALQLFQIGRICESKPSLDSVIMANSLINSAPLVVGITDPSLPGQSHSEMSGTW